MVAHENGTLSASAARRRVEGGDLGGEVGEGVEAQGRGGGGGRGVVLDGGPGAAVDEGRAQAQAGGGANVVVEAVADVQDLGGGKLGHLQQAPEEGGVRLGGTPVGGGGDQVGGQVQGPEDAAGPGGLVAGDADPEAIGAEAGQGGPDVGVQVFLTEPLGLAGVGSLLPGP